MSGPGSSAPSRDAAAAAPPLTHSQTQIWVGQRLNPESPLYNMAFAFVFPAGLRVDLFCEAWQRVADASDALRTRIVEGESGESRWTVAAHGRPTEVIDLDSAARSRQGILPVVPCSLHPPAAPRRRPGRQRTGAAR